MKRLLSLVIISLVVAGCTTRNLKETPTETAEHFEPPRDFVKYSDPSNNFEIYHPSDWTVRKNYRRLTVAFQSPFESKDDEIQENCGLAARDLPRKVSPDRLHEINKQQMRRQLRDFTMHGESKVTLRGGEAHRLDYSHRVRDFRSKAVMYVRVSGMRSYIVTCTATPDTFERYEETFRNIAGSFNTI